MNRRQFQKALMIASGIRAGNFNNINIFDGFSSQKYKSVDCTLDDVAALIHWEAINFDGTVNSKALSEIWSYKNKFNILDV